MKKKPETSTHTTDPDLVGGNAESSWVVGRNCVYHDRTVAQYRVSIRTPHGWKSYGHFDNLETATYVANVAILVERCEEKYELNKVGEKNKDELSKWRKLSNHADMEKLASDRFAQVEVELQTLQEQENERLEAERATSIVEYNGAKYTRHDGNWYSARTGERKTALDSELDIIWRQNKSIASGQSR